MTRLGKVKIKSVGRGCETETQMIKEKASEEVEGKTHMTLFMHA